MVWCFQSDGIGQSKVVPRDASLVLCEGRDFFLSDETGRIRNINDEY